MSLLKEGIPIVTVPPSPQRQLAAVIKDLKLEHVKLSRVFMILLDRLSPEEAHVLRLRAATILREFDDILNELDFMLREIAGGD
jgi:hypothetical protein